MAANNFDSTNPFTDDVHNAIRISMIIIDVAGDILRNKLEEIICNKNNTFIYKFRNILKKMNIFISIIHHF